MARLIGEETEAPERRSAPPPGREPAWNSRLWTWSASQVGSITQAGPLNSGLLPALLLPCHGGDPDPSGGSLTQGLGCSRHPLLLHPCAQESERPRRAVRSEGLSSLGSAEGRMAELDLASVPAKGGSVLWCELWGWPGPVRHPVGGRAGRGLCAEQAFSQRDRGTCHEPSAHCRLLWILGDAVHLYGKMLHIFKVGK